MDNFRILHYNMSWTYYNKDNTFFSIDYCYMCVYEHIILEYNIIVVL